jgi:hypothetical protein
MLQKYQTVKTGERIRKELTRGWSKYILHIVILYFQGELMCSFPEARKTKPNLALG